MRVRSHMLIFVSARWWSLLSWRKVGRIHDERRISCICELSSRDIGRIEPTIDGYSAHIVQSEGICSRLLDIEEPIIELFHACSAEERHRDELCGSYCVSVAPPMCCTRHHHREGRRYGRRGPLSLSEVAWRGVWVVRERRQRLSIDEGV